MQWLYRVIGQAGIFLICAQTVVHFRPKESYDKYLKLLLSVMLLLQLMQPVFTVFGGGEVWNAEEQVAGFTEELQTVLIRASEQAGQTEGKVQNTAAALAEKTEAGGCGQEAVETTVSGQEAFQKENDAEWPEENVSGGGTTESDGIRVEVAPIELE